MSYAQHQNPLQTQYATGIQTSEPTRYTSVFAAGG